MIYIASPYSHPSASVRMHRTIAAEKYAARLFREGKVSYSPIASWHHVAQLVELPTDADAWLWHNRAFLNAATEVHVLQLPGWDASVGVAQEVAYAKEREIPVRYVRPDNG